MPDRKIDALVLVYDATSGPWGLLVDTAMKVLRIRGCPLCTITHSVAGERSEWRTCRVELGVPLEHYHRDDQPEDVRSVCGDQLPCILARAGGQILILVDAEAIRRCSGSVADLRGKLLFHAARSGLSFGDVAVHA